MKVGVGTTQVGMEFVLTCYSFSSRFARAQSRKATKGTPAHRKTGGASCIQDPLFRKQVACPHRMRRMIYGEDLQLEGPSSNTTDPAIRVLRHRANYPTLWLIPRFQLWHHVS